MIILKSILQSHHIDQGLHSQCLHQQYLIYDKSKVFEVDLATYNAQYADSPLKILPSYGMHDRFLLGLLRSPNH